MGKLQVGDKILIEGLWVLSGQGQMQGKEFELTEEFNQEFFDKYKIKYSVKD